MAFYGAFAPPLVVPPREFSVGTVRVEPYRSPHTADVAIHLPQGRAPPS
jgi:hypothetical protein